MENQIIGSIVFNEKKTNAQDIKCRQKIFEKYLKRYILSNSVVGIMLARGEDLIISALAAMNIGVPFVYLDENMPSERIKNIIAMADIDIIITTPKYVDNQIFKDKYILYNEDITGNVNNANNEPYMKIKNEIMYILFTSGTTGLPKGVKISYDAFTYFSEAINEIIKFVPSKTIVSFTTASFDIFLLESVVAIQHGLTVVLANEEEQCNPKLMAKLIEKNNIDILQMTPSRMQLLYNYDRNLYCLRNIKEILIGGEKFPLNLLKALQNKTSAKIYNMYGPTEATIWSTFSDLTYKRNIDIGFPLKNTEIYIVDSNLTVLPKGQIGEICIGGTSLSNGYVKREDLTHKKFIFLPQIPKKRIFRTGDIGFFSSDGSLVYLGRNDNQVKIRGYRIELEEIEECINQVRGINQSIVSVRFSNEGDAILEAFYTSDFHVESQKIIKYLSTKLPSYMIPVTFKNIDSFFYTSNGKIDRKRIYQCCENESERKAKIVLTDNQKEIFDVILSHVSPEIAEDISINSKIKDSGIDSIAFINIIVNLEDIYQFMFDDDKLQASSFTTIKSLIEYVEKKR